MPRGARKEAYVGCTIVETTSGKLALRFRWIYPDGTRHRPSVTTPFDSTDDNRRTLRARAELIGAEIRAGVFDPLKHFEVKPRFGIELPKRPPLRVEGSLAELMREWIEGKRRRGVRVSRVRDYSSHLENYFTKADIGRADPFALTRAAIEAFLTWLLTEAGEDGKGVSEKTAANVIRGTLRAFLRDVEAPLAPLEKIAWERYAPTREQDPFDAAERDKILAWFKAKRSFAEYVSIQLRFAGITPSEVRGLRVGDFDRAAGSVTIRRSSHLGSIGATKTRARERTVFLAPALARAVAELAGIRPPVEPLLVVAEDTLRDNWTRALVAQGLRHRSLYQAKHTYATLALVAGESPALVARNLGISLATLEKHYAAALQKGRIRGKLDQEIGPRSRRGRLTH